MTVFDPPPPTVRRDNGPPAPQTFTTHQAEIQKPERGSSKSTGSRPSARYLYLPALSVGNTDGKGGGGLDEFTVRAAD